MTRDEKIQAYALWMDGAACREIGERFGVSRAYIHQILHKRQAKKQDFNQYAYPALAREVYTGYHSVSQFAEKIGVHPQTLYTIFNGEGDPRKATIDLILSATGMTYEEAFSKEKLPEEEE